MGADGAKRKRTPTPQPPAASAGKQRSDGELPNAAKKVRKQPFEDEPYLILQTLFTLPVSMLRACAGQAFPGHATTSSTSSCGSITVSISISSSSGPWRGH